MSGVPITPSNCGFVITLKILPRYSCLFPIRKKSSPDFVILLAGWSAARIHSFPSRVSFLLLFLSSASTPIIQFLSTLTSVTSSKILFGKNSSISNS